MEIWPTPDHLTLNVDHTRSTSWSLPSGHLPVHSTVHGFSFFCTCTLYAELFLWTTSTVIWWVAVMEVGVPQLWWKAGVADHGRLEYRWKAHGKSVQFFPSLFLKRERDCQCKPYVGGFCTAPVHKGCLRRSLAYESCIAVYSECIPDQDQHGYVLLECTVRHHCNGTQLASPSASCVDYCMWVSGKEDVYTGVYVHLWQWQWWANDRWHKCISVFISASCGDHYTTPSPTQTCCRSCLLMWTGWVELAGSASAGLCCHD